MNYFTELQERIRPQYRNSHMTKNDYYHMNNDSSLVDLKMPTANPMNCLGELII